MEAYRSSQQPESAQYPPMQEYRSPMPEQYSAAQPSAQPMMEQQWTAQQHQAYSGVPFPQPEMDVASNQASEDWNKRAAAPKRGLTKRVKLRRGHLVLDHPAVPAIRNSVEPRWQPPLDNNGRSEITHMRYTAITCDPDDFTVSNGWSIRTKDYNRPIELVIAVTAYNEDRILLTRTLHGIAMNIRDISRSDSKFWRGKMEDGTRIPAWQRIVVCIIMDGIDPCDKRALDVLSLLGIFQDNIMKRQVNGEEVQGHLFEYTTQLSVEPDRNGKTQLVEPSRDGKDMHTNLVPIQYMLLIKQKNAKKINSHRWLFNGFCRQMNPNVCILIDAGTKPGHKSLYHLWNAFHNDKNLGGACGEIYAQTNGGRLLFNPLVAAQNFEYKISNILDKPLESSFGFVSVLPGAFSAYRYRALIGRPLQQYFQGERKLASMNIFKKNMFLAEDRILCFELVAKAGCAWHLSYIKASKGETDVPSTTAELVSQRRRWLNGSFAASIYSLVHFFEIYRSRHNILRLFFFHIQAIFNILVLVFTWFAPSNLWLTFSIIITLVPESTGIYVFGNETITAWVNTLALWIYAGTLLMTFVIALGNKPKAESGLYTMAFLVNAILGYYLIACAFILTINAFLGTEFDFGGDAVEQLKEIIQSEIAVLLAALMSSLGVYIINSFLYGEFGHVFHSFIPYLGLAPSFINILNTYSFCNLHDVSWGTKGSDMAEALPAVNTKSNGSLEVEEKFDADLMDDFRKTAIRALAPHRPPPEKRNISESDSNATFRTRLVLFWMLSNALIVGTIQNIAGQNPDEDVLRDRRRWYFTVVLLSVFFITMVKFLGSLWFWVFHIFLSYMFRCCRKS